MTAIWNRMWDGLVIDMDKDLYQNILDGVNLGLIYADEQGRVTYCNFAAEKLLALEREKLLGKPISGCYSSFPVRERIMNIFKQVLAGEEGEVTVTIGERSIEHHCSPVKNPQGQSTGVIVALTDVSEKVRAQSDLARSRDELEILHEAAQLMNSSLELKQILDKLLEIMKRVVNYSCCRIYLYQEEDRNLRLEAQYEEQMDSYQEPEPEVVLKKVLDTGVSIYQEVKQLNLTIPLKRGKEVLGVIYMLIQHLEEFPEHVQQLLVNLASLSCLAIKNGQMFQRIHELATMDGLTKLYNRQYFDVIFNREVTRSKRFRTPLSLVMVDVNGLKEINDQMGHTVGDTILVQAAKVLQQTVRSIDYVFRYGGDEMVILLIEADEQMAGIVVKRIREKEAQWNAGRGNKSPLLSLSVGFASTEGGQTADELLVKADRLMYQNKEQYYRGKFSYLSEPDAPEQTPEG